MQPQSNLSPLDHVRGGLQILITSTLLTGYISWFIRELLAILVTTNPWSDGNHGDDIRSLLPRDKWGGTFGTLASAVVIWLMLQAGVHFTIPIIVGAASFFVGWWACGPGEAYTVAILGPGTKHGKRGAQVSDLSATNIDEFAPFLMGCFPICFLDGNEAGQLLLLVSAFIGFRVLDGAKPPFVKYFEDKYEGTPWGVMVDDLVAMLPVTVILLGSVLISKLL